MNPETISASNKSITESTLIATHHESNDNPEFVTIKYFNQLKDVIYSILTMMKSSTPPATIL